MNIKLDTKSIVILVVLAAIALVSFFGFAGKAASPDFHAESIE